MKYCPQVLSGKKITLQMSRDIAIRIHSFRKPNFFIPTGNTQLDGFFPVPRVHIKLLWFWNRNGKLRRNKWKVLHKGEIVERCVYLHNIYFL